MSAIASHRSLPDGFIDELLAKFSEPTRLHLIRNVCNETPDSKNLSCRQIQTSNLNDDGKTQSANKNDLQQLPEDQRGLQPFILSNITEIGELHFSSSGPNLDHTLRVCQLITQHHLCNLTAIKFKIDPGFNWSDSSLLPSLFSSLPRLKSFTLPGTDYDQPLSPFSFPRLFTAGQSSHIESLDLSSTKLTKAHFKHLALHSNFTFPALTKLNISWVNIEMDSGNDTADSYSAMHYFLQWVEKQMPKLTHLNLLSCNLTTAHIATDLSNSPILSRLESLDLSRNSQVEAKGWQTLFSSTQFGSQHTAKLKTLKLDYNSGIQPLITLLTQKCPFLTNLTTLSLNKCDLNDTSVQSICKSKWIRALESLSLLTNDRITSKAIQTITNCEGMKNLTSLELDRQRSPDFFRHITQSQHVSKLTHIVLDFPYDQSADQVLLDFFHSPKASALTNLDFITTNFPASTMKSILLSPMLVNLEALSVFMVTSDRTEWLDAFVASSNSSKLGRLTLTQCGLTDSNILSISQSPHLSNLRHLDLSRNPSLTNDSVKFLVQSEGMKLKQLNLSSNSLLTPLIFHHLAQSPRFLSCLEQLSTRLCSLIRDEHRKIVDKAGWFEGRLR